MLTRSADSPEGHGLIVPKTKDGRVVFLLPWLGAAIAGTTDAPTQLTMEPRATAPEVDFILDALGDYITVKPRREDVLSAWSGIRPLAADPSKGSTENITRDHVLAFESGMLTITGGKWTTYRRARASCGRSRAQPADRRRPRPQMAEDAVDLAVSKGGLREASPCITQALPLAGATGWHPGLFAELAQLHSLDSHTAKHLAHAYGDRALAVLEVCSQVPAERSLA